MGICASDISQTEANENKANWDKSRQVDHDLAEANMQDSQIIKLLLLGAGESGKSTLFKALISIYGGGFSEEKCQGFTSVVRTNTTIAMRCLIEQAAKYGPLQTEEAKAAEKFLSEQRFDDQISKVASEHIKKLWADPGIQETFGNRVKFQLLDSAAYFFENIDRIAEPNYIPNQDDILRCRVRTTGIKETDFKIDGTIFKMVDVGGQKNERKKWIHCFEGVTAVIFVAALSEYDQTLFEDELKNRMEDALELFDEICNSQWFRSTSMLLFLNKRDLFLEKVDNVPLSVCPSFKDYKGKGYEEGCEYIQQEFLALNKNTDKEVYPHITCAIDTDVINRVFDNVKEIIIRESLEDAGLV